MINQLTYIVDGSKVNIEVHGDNEYVAGDDIILAQRFDDLVANHLWNVDGFVLEKFFSEKKMNEIKKSIISIVENVLRKFSVDLDNFTLENYHEFVDDVIHAEVIAHTKRLYPKDFGIDVYEIVEKISNLIGVELSFFNPLIQANQWIICRINRPHSKDYNPAHKDIYECYDEFGYIPQMINCWIPICGVTANTGLPVAAGSHLLSEKDIVRTKAGSKMNGLRYNVNSIAKWGRSNSLSTLAPRSGEAIIFSSYLIHGLARNLNENTTRISFEFRLYKS